MSRNYGFILFLLSVGVTSSSSLTTNPNVHTAITNFPLRGGYVGTYISYTITANGRTVTVPGQVSAVIYPDMVGNDRTSFSSSVAVNDRMRAMNRRPTDERGHIIASQLGGLPFLENLFPQSPNFNRNVGSTTALVTTWVQVENAVADFISSTGGYVLWDTEFFYENGAEPFRPSSVRLSADFYDSDGRQSANYPGYECLYSNEDRQPICVPRSRVPPQPTTTTTTVAPPVPAPNPGLTGVIGWTVGAAAVYQCGGSQTSG